MIRRWQQASVVPAEQPIAIQRDAIVSPIAQTTRDNAQQFQQLPAPRQLPDHFQECIRALPIMPVADHRHGVEFVQRQTGPRQQGLALGRLHGRQPHAALAVMANQKTRPAVAQFAHAVEQHHGFAGLEQWRGGRACFHGRHRRMSLAAIVVIITSIIGLQERISPVLPRRYSVHAAEGSAKSRVGQIAQ